MVEATLQSELDEMISFLATRAGEVEPGLSWQSFASLLRTHSDLAMKVLITLMPPPEVEAPPPGENYESWSEDKRRKANINALRALREFQQSGRAEPTELERRAMAAYSGLGGIRVVDLPDDPNVFPELYVAGIRNWKKAIAEGRVPTGPGTDLFRGLRHQFFTPIEVCRAMWGLALRATPFQPETALETSAGIGRFMRTAPLGLRWTAVENDALLADFLRASFPDLELYPSEFERFAVGAETAGRSWDLTIGNPPFPERPGVHRDLDPKWAGWRSGHTYFTDRTLSLVRPGGLMVFLTPMSEITGQDDENIALRKWLISRGHFLGAIFPPSGIFPGVREGRFAIHVWVRRVPNGTPVITQAEETFVAGRYLDTPEGQANVIGAWVEGPRGAYLKGDFDPTRVVNAVLYPIPADAMAALRQWRDRSVSTRPPARPLVSVVDEPAEPEADVPVEQAPGTVLLDVARPDAGVLDAASALSYRIAKFTNMVNQGQHSLAEEGREELKHDVLEFVRRWGNPHEIKELRGYRRRLAALLAAIDTDGVLSPLLSRQLAPAEADAPTAGASLVDVVSFYSGRYGVCTDSDLERHFPDQDLVQVIAAVPEIAVEMRPDGHWWFYRFGEYASGDLYAKLDSVRNMLAADDGAPEGQALTPIMRAKLEEQQTLLMATIRPKVLIDIEATPRSGFVPVRCLQDFVNVKLNEMASAARVSGLAAIELYEDHARLRCNTNNTLVTDAQVNWLTFLLAYWNRELQAVDPDEKQAGRKRVFGDSPDVDSKLRKEKALEDDFKTWLLKEPDWGPSIEEAYNRGYRGYALRTYETAPVAIARLNNVPPLHPHQNAGVRRLTERRGGIVAWDVGAGKSSGAIATIAMWRQRGIAYRPIIVVPGSVLANWYSETRKRLPDYRVGIIGITPIIGVGGAIETKRKTGDSQEERLKKWMQFAQGAYDVLICTHDNFTLDVEMGDDTLLRILSRQMWIQRGLGKDEEERRLLERRILAAEQEIGSVRDQIDNAYSEAEIAKLQMEITKLESNIQQWRRDLRSPSDLEIEKIREDLEKNTAHKPFRPRRKVQAVWKESQSKAELIAVARSYGLEADETWKKKELIEALHDKAPAATDASEPVPGLVRWEDLGCDALFVDEAHAYKNLWYPSCRLGTDKIEFMGSCSESLTIRAWDMFLKCQELLDRRDDTGVVLLTATPIKNGPLELYSLLSLVSSRVWSQRNIRNKEEFVDRYCKMEEVATGDAVGEVKTTLGVTEFKSLDELRSIMDIYVDRQTTKDLLASGSLKKVPESPPRRIELEMDEAQQRAYSAAKTIIEEEMGIVVEPWCKYGQTKPQHHRSHDEDAEPMEQKDRGRLFLLLLDLLSKAALDVRLLRKDIEKLLVQKSEDDEVREKYDAWVKRGRRGKRPAAPLDDRERETLEIRLNMLLSIDVEGISRTYEETNTSPPKYEALAAYVAQNATCGHVVFSDFNETHQWIADTIKRYAPHVRVAPFMTSAVSKTDRLAISRAFNGQAQEVSPEGVVIQEAMEPEYDVIIGNTQVMGEGMNLQRRTCAIHHMNFPWEPASITQRNGRGVRQGNTLEKVDLRYYISKRSFDGFKLNLLLGKAEWQESLFGKAETISNPAAGMAASREEIMIELFIDDQEEAQCQYERLKAERERALIAKKREEAKRRFISLVNQYARARREKDPGIRSAGMAIADRLASELRTEPDIVFPHKAAIDLARDRIAYYNPNTGLMFGEGERLCLKPDLVDSKPVRFEITRLQVTPSGPAITYRKFGGIEVMYAGDPASMFNLGAGMAVHRLDLSYCGGWDEDEDRRRIFDNPPSLAKIRDLSMDLVDRLGAAALWKAMVDNGVEERRVDIHIASTDTSGFTPLVDADGDILLLSSQGAQALLFSTTRPDLHRLITEDYSILLPQRRGSWSMIMDALKKDRLRVIILQGETWAPRGYEIVPLEDRRDVPALTKLATWFRQGGIAAGALKEWRERRAAKARRDQQRTEMESTATEEEAP